MGASTTLAAPVTPLSASAYRDSVGVQMHHSFTNYAYDQEPASTLGAELKGVGVHHVRDSVCLNTEAVCAGVRAKLASLKDAFGPAGPPVDLLLGYSLELKSQPDRAARDADIERGLTAAQSAPLAGMVAGLEGVNEPDLKDTANWQQATLADEATTARLLAQPRFAALRSVSRLSPAVGHASNTALLQAAGWNGAATTGNFHPYPPAWGGPENGLTTPCGSLQALACGRSLGSGAAPIASESGYSTAGSAYSQGWVSEKAQATYLPRLLLENFSRGVARTYLYELIDLEPSRSSTTNGYGLWHSRQVGGTIRVADAKPAAWALARLHAEIGDLGTATSPATPLDVTIKDAGGAVASTDAVRRVLLQRADGSYALALWQPKSVFNNALLNQRDTAVADVKVDVTLGSPSESWSATMFRPSLSGVPVARVTPASHFTASVGADVTLIDLRSSQVPLAKIAADAATGPLGGSEPNFLPAGTVVPNPASPGESTPAPAPTAAEPKPGTSTASGTKSIEDALAAVVANIQARISVNSQGPAPLTINGLKMPANLSSQAPAARPTAGAKTAKAKAKALARAKAKAKARAKARARAKLRARQS